MVIPGPRECLAVSVAVVAVAAEAEGFSRENVRSADIIPDVHFSSAWRALGSVVAGWRVAWWGTILGRGRDVRVLVLVVVVEGVFVESCEVGSEVVSESVSVADCSLGTGMPVKAVHISSAGGVGSLHGTVKSGLSQRLWVVGSS